jgi:Ni/Fe-hydrogenase subunit HybB-like protein
MDGSTIFLLSGILVETKIFQKRNFTDDRLFKLLVWLNLFLSMADMVTYLADENEFKSARYFNMGGISVYYLILNVMFMVWLHYCLVRFGDARGSQGNRYKAIFLPGVITEVLLIVNLLTGIIFYVDESNIYHYGVLYIPMFLEMAYFAILSLVITGRYRRGVEKEALVPIWIFVLPILASLIVSFGFGGINLTCAGCAMAILFTHLGSAAELDYYGKGGEAS